MVKGMCPATVGRPELRQNGYHDGERVEKDRSALPEREMHHGECPLGQPGAIRSPVDAYGSDGADEGTRTPDPRITNALLYQLSYIGLRRGA